MSIQLSLYWHAPEHIEWVWSNDDTVHQGALDELLNEKQSRNLPSIPMRLFLPGTWFSSIDVRLPKFARSLSAQTLKFAAEEYIAQDIDSVHLSPMDKQLDGTTSVLVTEIDRFKQILNTLQMHDLTVVEAFSDQAFILPEDAEADVIIQLHQTSVTVWSGQRFFTVHQQGFAQWFALWSDQIQLKQDAKLHLYSDSSEGFAKTIAAEFESSGYAVTWKVQQPANLIDWHHKASKKIFPGNLIHGEFLQKSSTGFSWMATPALVAIFITCTLWVIVSVIQNQQIGQQIEQTWNASENVFLQVFGQNKRIQRPLMVREMRSAAELGQSDSSEQTNALRLLNDLTAAPDRLFLEEFRYNDLRKEAYVTLIQSISESDDAFSNFEALKSSLSAQGYAVEYSANQDSDHYRAQFKVVYGVDS